MGASSEEQGVTQLTPFQESVLKLLRGSADTYQERSAVYKDNFRSVGRVMEALFPDGAPKLGPAVDYDRWHIFELIIVKLTRYANNYNDGGHEDSVVDMVAYLGILHALDEEFAKRREEEAVDAEEVAEPTSWGLSPEANAARMRPSPFIPELPERRLHPHEADPHWRKDEGVWKCNYCGYPVSSEVKGAVTFWVHE